MKASRPAAWGARELAWRVLESIEKTQARLEVALNLALSQAELSRRDQALASELVYGTCRWQGLLDHVLALCAKRPLDNLSPGVLNLLRLGAYQLLRLERVPASAAVHSSVELAKARLGPKAAGFVNAVLRRVAERAGEGQAGLSLPDPEADLAGHLAAAQSHPRWLVERWLTELGREEAAALLAANNQPPELILRVNPLALDRDDFLARLQAAGFQASAGRFSPQAVAVKRASLADLEALAPGAFSAQGEAAQLVCLALDPRPGWRVLDACAGAGGKTTHLAELMSDQGEVIGLDIDGQRLEVGRRLAEKLKLGSPRFYQADATGPWPQLLGEPFFDAVLVDTPCTGLGVLRSRPDRRWRLGPDDPARLARFQDHLLAAAAKRVKSAGVLVYATCTLTAEENQGAAARFLAAHPDFQVEDLSFFLPRPARHLVSADGFFQSWPHRHHLDGFFIARFKRSF